MAVLVCACVIVQLLIVRHCILNRLAVTDYHSVVLRPGQHLAVVASAQKHEVGGMADAYNAVLTAQPHGSGGRGGDYLGPATHGWAIQVAEPHCRDEHLQHVQVTVGIELVSRVVAGDSYRNAMRLELPQAGDTAPAGSAQRFGVPVLCPFVHQRQADNCQASSAAEAQCLIQLAVLLAAERAAVAAHHTALILVPDGCLCDAAQPLRLRVTVLVHMKVKVQVARLGQPKDAIQ
mmetsp:Transcript_38958/g.99630  ORF Transcript_38958/g.99630 Transcript_38958/m.99630 type:complete len:234 (-) Transcript_38958:857-1558(-)